MNEITIDLQLFGVFRKFGDTVNFTVPMGSTIAGVKHILKNKLAGETLVLDSVLANENTILRDSDVLNSNAILSILPPVCGG